jgi:hypothetical protein
MPSGLDITNERERALLAPYAQHSAKSFGRATGGRVERIASFLEPLEALERLASWMTAATWRRDAHVG